MGRATFWAIFSRTHLVALFETWKEYYKNGSNTPTSCSTEKRNEFFPDFFSSFFLKI
jgi:hypothetical protein